MTFLETYILNLQIDCLQIDFGTFGTLGTFGQLGPSGNWDLQAIGTFGQFEVVGSSYIKKMHRVKIKSMAIWETRRVIENIKLT
jgi:hypothetical protein